MRKDIIWKLEEAWPEEPGELEEEEGEKKPEEEEEEEGEGLGIEEEM